MLVIFSRPSDCSSKMYLHDALTMTFKESFSVRCIIACVKEKSFRSYINKPLKPVLSRPPCFVDEPSQDTNSVSSDESISTLSQSVKRMLPVPTEMKRKNAFLQDMSNSDVSSDGGKRCIRLITVINTSSCPSFIHDFHSRYQVIIVSLNRVVCCRGKRLGDSNLRK